ncbi:MAG: ComF family protein [Planctomycetota bacterium]|jgi:ComF family protein
MPRTGKKSTLVRVGNRILDVIYPRTCLVCNSPVKGSGAVFTCPACLEKIIFIGNHACRTCGTKVGPGAEKSKRCVACRDSTLVFRRCSAVGMYDGPLRDLIIQLKFRKLELTVADLGRWIADRYEETRGIVPDFLVPVPLHINRRRERGFDQAEILAEHVAKRSGVPLKKPLVRTRNTEPQTGLPPTGRQKNISGAFALSKKADVQGKRILLIDDVMTTGSTLAECSRALRNAGASSIECLILARATSV